MDPAVDEELYDKTVRKFITVENEHLKEEENWINELRGKMSRQEIEELEDTLKSAKSIAPLHPHPSAPTKPETGAKVVHKIAGVIDRAKKSITG